MQKIFDGHNDVLYNLLKNNKNNPVSAFIKGRKSGHIDLPRLKEANFAGGFFAIYVPSNEDKSFRYKQMQQAEYELPLPKKLTQNFALQTVLKTMSLLLKIENDSKGALKICYNSKDVATCDVHNRIAVIAHMEGAEAIDKDFDVLEVLYKSGLRSIGPVWSRPTQFAHGVPFAFPRTPDIGPGLTDLGKELVKICNQKKILIDLSHMNEAGFWDVARLSDAPLVATHSNAHALCQHSRNLTDKQLSAIKSSGGMVGVNFAPAFLRNDGQMVVDTNIDWILRHLEHLVNHLGIDGVGFGSDFDGVTLPKDMDGVLGLNIIRSMLLDSDYDKESLNKICYENWINVLNRTIE